MPNSTDEGSPKDVPSADHASAHNATTGNAPGIDRGSGNAATASDVTGRDTKSEGSTSGGRDGDIAHSGDASGPSGGDHGSGTSRAMADSGDASGPSGGNRGSETTDVTRRAKILRKDTSDFQIISSGHTMSVSRHVVIEVVALKMQLEVDDAIRVTFFANTNEVDVGRRSWIWDVRHDISDFKIMSGDGRSVPRDVVADAFASGVSLKVDDKIRVTFFANTNEVDVGRRSWIWDVRHDISDFKIMSGDGRSVPRDVEADAFALGVSLEIDDEIRITFSRISWTTIRHSRTS